MALKEQNFTYFCIFIGTVNFWCFIYSGSPYRDSECLVGSPVGIGVNSGSTIPDASFEASTEMSSVRSAKRGRLMEASGKYSKHVAMVTKITSLQNANLQLFAF